MGQELLELSYNILSKGKLEMDRKVITYDLKDIVKKIHSIFKYKDEEYVEEYTSKGVVLKEGYVFRLDFYDKYQRKPSLTLKLQEVTRSNLEYIISNKYIYLYEEVRGHLHYDVKPEGSPEDVSGYTYEELYEKYVGIKLMTLKGRDKKILYRFKYKVVLGDGDFEEKTLKTTKLDSVKNAYLSIFENIKDIGVEGKSKEDVISDITDNLVIQFISPDMGFRTIEVGYGGVNEENIEDHLNVVLRWGHNIESWGSVYYRGKCERVRKAFTYKGDELLKIFKLTLTGLDREVSHQEELEVNRVITSDNKENREQEKGKVIGLGDLVKGLPKEDESGEREDVSDEGHDGDDDDGGEEEFKVIIKIDN